MKFAREIEQDAVPEWKIKYLNYKQAKKKLKAISSALRNLDRTPLAPSLRSGTLPTPPNGVGTGLLVGPTGKVRSKKSTNKKEPTDSEETEVERSDDSATATQRKATTATGKKDDPKRRTSSEPLFDEEERQKGQRVPRQGIVRYGSIIGSPPKHDEAPLASLELPAPAISAAGNGRKRGSKVVRIPDPKAQIDGDEPSPSAYEAGRTRTPPYDRVTFRKGNPFKQQSQSWDRSRFRRLLSVSQRGQSPATKADSDLPMNVYDEFETAQSDFFRYLDDQLEKIEDFYQQKENEASQRFEVLKEQLHILRDRRIADLHKVDREVRQARGEGANLGQISDSEDTGSKTSSNPLFAAVDRAWNTAINGRVGRQTKAMESETTPEAFRPMDGHRDYERRAQEMDIPYRTAKRKLKLALQEYYRSLELIKSYTLLNRTAFRKITKKYDKTVNARPTGRYMSEKVSKAHFIKSDVIDGYITSVEDLYSRYFEAGNHKVAANKLRKASKQRQYHGGAMFRNGLTIMLGSVLGVQGLVAAGQLLYRDDPVVVAQTSYLLQIYAGYFFMTLLMLFFCLACQFWTRSRVNYVFIFEFDTRYHLDWRQLLEIPCLCWALLGFFVWINFSRYGDHDMYIYFPVILIVTTFFILFCPFPIIHWKARAWFLNACLRLFFSGLFPVEFRDFFLGDMFCSLTYSMGNVELFFCLYVNDWENPGICNSSNSRLLGFFSTLPGIWRALQCLRRYWDTRNAFPHLANFGKYTFTILFYMSLSLYRIHKVDQLFAFFIFCGAINSVYCSVWDLLMDWSLLNPYAKKRFLRDTLAYRQTWIYYVALVLDPILRMNWIFYAIFAQDIQHSAILSFFVALSEVCRRGMWLVFRVENEHCTNVGRFRASRDVPLPFNLCSLESPAVLEEGLSTIVSQNGSIAASTSLAPNTPAGAASIGTHATPATTTGSQQQSTPSLRRRRLQPSPMMTRLGSIIHMAHAQDFERRKKDEDIVDASNARGFGMVDDDDGDSTDEDMQGIVSLGGSDVEHEISADAGLGTLRTNRNKGKKKGEGS